MAHDAAPSLLHTLTALKMNLQVSYLTAIYSTPLLCADMSTVLHVHGMRCMHSTAQVLLSRDKPSASRHHWLSSDMQALQCWTPERQQLTISCRLPHMSEQLSDVLPWHSFAACQSQSTTA